MRLIKRALTFDDVLLVPAYSNVLPRETELKTALSRRIALQIPLISAAMDTVTEARLAIAMAQEGGIGIIHKNLAPNIQAEHVRRVKRYESGIVSGPDHRGTRYADSRGARDQQAASHFRAACGARENRDRNRDEP